MSDIFTLAKSEQENDLLSTPFSSKQDNFINDINSGVYTNSQQSLVQFDMSSIYNSSAFLDVAQVYIVFPMVYTACYANANPAPVQPTANAGNEWLITPKSGSWNLIHSLEIVVNGKTIIQQSPLLSLHTNFKLLSQMSKDDLQAFGRTLGVQPDDVQSYFYNGPAQVTANGAIYGNGLTNNSIFPIQANGAIGNMDMDEQIACSTYGTIGTVYNSALQMRSSRIANNLATPANNMNLLLPVASFANEFRPNFQIVNGNYMTWTDYAVVRLQDISDFFAQAPLCKNFNGLLRIYVNTGTMNIGLSQGNFGMMLLNGANSTFQNVCPFTINQLPLANIPAGVTNLVVSCTIARSTVSTTQAGVQLSLSNFGSPMNACRLYYSMINMQPEVASKYLSSNQAKEINFTNILANSYSSIPATSNFNQLVQSGIRNIRGVLIIAYLAKIVNGLSNFVAVTPFNTYSSPFDTAPNTTPMSITQLNVQIGGVNVMNNVLSYTYEQYLEHVTLYDKINASEMGLSCGLMSQLMWENGYRYYYVDCSRGSKADQNTPRNVVVNLYNNNNAAVDLYIFTEYFDSVVMNVQNGNIQD